MKYTLFLILLLSFISFYLSSMQLNPYVSTQPDVKIIHHYNLRHTSNTCLLNNTLYFVDGNSTLQKINLESNQQTALTPIRWKDNISLLKTNKKNVFALDGNTIRVFDKNNNNEIKSYNVYQNTTAWKGVSSFACNKNHLVAAVDNYIQWWDLSTNELLYTHTLEKEPYLVEIDQHDSRAFFVCPEKNYDSFSLFSGDLNSLSRPQKIATVQDTISTLLPLKDSILTGFTTGAIIQYAIGKNILIKDITNPFSLSGVHALKKWNDYIVSLDDKNISFYNKKTLTPLDTIPLISYKEFGLFKAYSKWIATDDTKIVLAHSGRLHIYTQKD